MTVYPPDQQVKLGKRPHKQNLHILYRFLRSTHHNGEGVTTSCATQTTDVPDATCKTSAYMADAIYDQGMKMKIAKSLGIRRASLGLYGGGMDESCVARWKVDALHAL